MTDADLSLVKIDSNGSTFIVYGPFEYQYGRLQYGWVVKEPDGKFKAISVPLGKDEKKITVAVSRKRYRVLDALKEWAENHITAEALDKEFMPETADGTPIRFKRRIKDRIVAQYLTKARGWVQTTWGEDGVCDFFRNPSKKDELSVKIDKGLRLVRRDQLPI